MTVQTLPDHWMDLETFYKRGRDRRLDERERDQQRTDRRIFWFTALLILAIFFFDAFVIITWIQEGGAG